MNFNSYTKLIINKLITETDRQTAIFSKTTATESLKAANKQTNKPKYKS